MIDLVLRLPAGERIDLAVVWEDGEGDWHEAHLLLEVLADELGLIMTQDPKAAG